MEKKQKNYLKFNYVPLLTDFILRWIVLGALRFDYIGYIWFWIINIIVIPIFIIFLLIINSVINKIKFAENEVKNTSLSIITCLFIFICGIYVTYNLAENIHTFWKVLITVTTFLGYGFYIFVINILSVKKPSSIGNELLEEDFIIVNTTNTDADINTYSRDTHDSNDVNLVRVEGILTYTNDRVNSYILESALFSGLAFAGFITLITSDKLQISHIPTLLISIKELLDSLIYFKISYFNNQIKMFTQDDLFILILIESLFCTLAFVSVIASRLRFSDILEEVEISVKTARSFKDKEEEIYLLNLELNEQKYSKRLNYLRSKITKEIAIANKKLTNLRPILSTIRIIRSIGMTFFLSMIITSALIINSFFAFFLFLSSILVAIIMNIEHSFRIKKVKSLNIHLPRKKINKIKSE